MNLTPIKRGETPATAFLEPWLAQYGPNTARAYRADLETFFAHTRRALPAEADIFSAVRSFASSLTGCGATAARRISSVRSFYGFLCGLGVLDRNPATYIRSPRAHSRVRPTLTREEVDRMLNAVNRSGTLGKRDYCILLILSELGLRRREVASLRKSSITKSADGRTLLNFTGKREQERCVPISRRLDLALGDYLGSNGQAQTSDDGPIFLNASHGRLSDSAIYDLVAKHALAAQIAKPVTPHSFRHFAITEAAEVEESTLSLRAFSGHRSVASLTRYTHINELRAIERIQMKRGIT